MYGQNYGYRTSLSPLMISHMKNKFLHIINKYKFKKNSNILDIASNDGTFLNFFTKTCKDLELYGCDPSSQKFKKYYHKSVNLIVDYFPSKKLKDEVKLKNNKKFSLITSFAMFYDIQNPNKFCKEIFQSLDKDGVWILELSYLPLLMKKLNYDQICHEHIAYYSLTTFKKIAEKNKLKILDCSFNEINGGSIHIECSKKNSIFKANFSKINKIIYNESKITHKDYHNFNVRIENVKKNLVEFIKISRKANKKILGYGASTKGNIVLNHCEIDNKILEYIGDANREKHGRYTPGSNIKIISKTELRKKKTRLLSSSYMVF